MRLSKAKFKAWLKEQCPTTVVGMSGTGGHCPVATYVRDTHKVSYVCVTPHYVEADGDYTKCPEWAVRYIKLVDNHPLLTTLSARYALEVLNKI